MQKAEFKISKRAQSQPILWTDNNKETQKS